MRVSVVIPVYNGAATVAASIESALSQRFDEPAEVIVVNDGSTDDTLAVLKGFEKQITMVERPNGGLSAARNSGVAAATGDFLAFLDADDLWLPDKLALTVGALESQPGAILAYSDAIQADEKGVQLAATFVMPEAAHAPSLTDLLSQWWPILPSTTVIRRSVYERLGGFADEMRSYEDMDFWLRAREIGEFIYVPRPLVVYRVSPVTERLVKYEQSYQLFARRVAERYGKAGRPLMRRVRHAHSSALGFRGLLAMRRGDMREARHSFGRALRYEPMAPRTVLRLLRTFLPDRVSRMLTGRTREIGTG